MNTLTAKQAQVLSVIRHYMALENRAPTQFEIAEIIGKTHQTIHRHINYLEEKGYIIRLPEQSRNIRLVDRKVFNVPVAELFRGE